MGSELILYGVGRSGTTTLYSTIQTMLLENFGDNVDFVYEPFLWSPKIFNKHAREVTDEFSYMASVSVDGMYANKVLPLLPIEAAETSWNHLDKNIRNYLQQICIKKMDKKFLFSKIIRANGRAALFEYLNPKLKSIFVLRNPIDVINSSVGMFSFYGTDFHASDYDRFYYQAVELYGEEAKECPVSSQVEKEAFYWYFSNKAFLDWANAKENILLIAYDAYITKKNKTIESIADFIDISVPQNILQEAENKVGPTTKGSKLTEKDLSELLFYHKKYIELMNIFFPSEKIMFDDVVKKHEASIQTNREDGIFFGRAPLYIQNQLKHIKREERKSKKRLFRFLK